MEKSIKEKMTSVSILMERNNLNGIMYLDFGQGCDLKTSILDLDANDGNDRSRTA